VYSIVLMTALVSGGQAANSFGYSGHYGWGCWGCWGCGGCYGWGSCYGCCGTVTPWLMPGPSLPAAEQKKWDDYVSLFDSDDDKKELNDLWTRADITARWELIKKIPVLPPPKEEAEKDKPLSAEEKKKWDAYVKKLKGEKKQQAEEAWEKADLKGKRKLIEGIPGEK
jgi:hypothetical protein